MELNKAQNWIARWAKSKFGEQSPYTIPPMIQPVLQASNNWPLNLVLERRTGSVGSGLVKLKFYPGEERGPTGYPEADRHHAVYRWFDIIFTQTRTMRLFVYAAFPGEMAIDQLYGTTVAALEHHPLIGVLPDRRHIQWPFYLQIDVDPGTAGTYTIDTVRFDLPETDPLPF